MKKSIYDKKLTSLRPQITMNSFCLLLAEIAQYYLKIGRPYEEELLKLGENIGYRVIELIYARDKSLKRETKHIEMLRFVVNNVWKFMFDKVAENLERSKALETQFMIKDSGIPILKFISEMYQDKIGSFLGGIIKGVLCSAGFTCKVECHKDKDKNQIVFIIDFDQSVIDREKTK